MAPKPQSYATHRRLAPVHHYFVQPVFVINLIVQIVRLVRDPSLTTGWWVVVAAALIGVGFSARLMARTNQDRIIRLEERLRLTRLLPDDLRGRMDEFKTRQLIALRFAPDSEVPDLARRCLAGELPAPDQIKRAVRDWRPDYLRV